MADDYKSKCVLKQFKKTFNKEYENYCVTRIYHLIDNDDVQMVTQQVIQTSEGNYKLADIYFPQLNIWVEIDEAHHENQAEEDKIRTKEMIESKIVRLEEVVREITLEEPIRIKTKDKTLKEINKDIANIVNLINEKIKKLKEQGKFIPWNPERDNPQKYIELRKISIKDNVQFSLSYLVSELFNKGYSKGARKLYFQTKEGVNSFVWCPKLSLDEREIEKYEYFNKITFDGEEISEEPKEKNKKKKFYSETFEEHEDPSENIYSSSRYVFAYYRCPDGKYAYKFRGVFKLDLEQTKMQEKRIWKKISDTADLTPFFND